MRALLLLALAAAGVQALSKMAACRKGMPLPVRGRGALAPLEAQALKTPGLSIGAGVAGIFILLANRLSVDLDRITDVQSRADIISVVACSALLLNVLSEQDIVARDREAVPLVGFALKSPVVSGDQQAATKWYIDAILQGTPATSVHVVRDSLVVGRGGVIGQGDPRTSGALAQADGGVPMNRMTILQKVLQGGEEVYLPDLQILPGKVEFTYLPINAQSVVILPLPDGAVVVATNQAKVFKVADLSRLRALTAVFRKQTHVAS